MALSPCRECGKDVSTEAASCPHCGVKKPVKPAGISTGMGCLAMIVVLVVVVQISGGGGGTDTPTARSVAEPPTRSPMDVYRDSIDFEFEWSLGGFDNVMLADFTFRNNGSRLVKDLEVGCAMSAASGTGVGEARGQILEAVAPGKTLRKRGFNMGFVNSQAKSARCSLRSFAW